MIEGRSHVASLDPEHELEVEDPSGLKPPVEEPSTGRRMTLNMGPQHPSTHGVLRVVLELDGETISRPVLKLDIFTQELKNSAKGRNISK